MSSPLWGGGPIAEIEAPELVAIPAERMKMRTAHIVPLSRQGIEVLEMLRTLTGKSEWLFPGDRNPNKCMSTSNCSLPTRLAML